MKRTQFGFSFVELMVTISVAAILLTIVMVNFQDARQQARDAQRQTDLRTIQAALELYKLKYGEYPAGCNGATTGTAPNWSGQSNGDYDCPSGQGNNYIVDLAPEFIPELPKDPRLNGANTGYVYTTNGANNGERSVYKLMALGTVETETIDYGHQFFRCGAEYDPGDSGDPKISGALINYESGDSWGWAEYERQAPSSPPNDIYSPTELDGEICERSPSSIGDSQYHLRGNRDRNSACTLVVNYSTSYAVSAGYSTDDRGSTDDDRGMEYDTEIVRCS